MFHRFSGLFHSVAAQHYNCREERKMSIDNTENEMHFRVSKEHLSEKMKKKKYKENFDFDFDFTLQFQCTCAKQKHKKKIVRKRKKKKHEKLERLYNKSFALVLFCHRSNVYLWKKEKEKKYCWRLKIAIILTSWIALANEKQNVSHNFIACILTYIEHFMILFICWYDVCLQYTNQHGTL